MSFAHHAEVAALPAHEADDETLLKTAVRIKARAIKRCGELLKQFQAPGARTDQPSADGDTRLTQRQAAEQAGLSKRQEVDAIRVANVPEEEFERLVEADEPATVTDLAERGKSPRPGRRSVQPPRRLRRARPPALATGAALELGDTLLQVGQDLEHVAQTLDLPLGQPDQPRRQLAVQAPSSGQARAAS